MKKRYILAITGASGAILGLRLLQELSRHSEVHLIISRNASMIISQETGIMIDLDKNRTLKNLSPFINGDVHLFHDDEMMAPISSGSFITDGMFIVPCSMKTLSSIASGNASNLIERAADVTIKEKRLLILSPREMPFNAIHLENMLKLSKLGVVIAPPVPGFYHLPETLEDMVNFIVGRILDLARIEHNLFRRWGI